MNILKHAEHAEHGKTCLNMLLPLDPTFQKVGSRGGSMFFPCFATFRACLAMFRVFYRFKHRACSNIFFSCSKNDFMFAHVRSCSACSACSQLVQGMFTRPEHAKHAIDCKNGKYFSDHVSFRHFMLRHVQRVQHVSACSHLVLIMFDLCSQKIKA